MLVTIKNVEKVLGFYDVREEVEVDIHFLTIRQSEAIGYDNVYVLETSRDLYSEGETTILVTKFPIVHGDTIPLNKHRRRKSHSISNNRMRIMKHHLLDQSLTTTLEFETRGVLIPTELHEYRIPRKNTTNSMLVHQQIDERCTYGFEYAVEYCVDYAFDLTCLANQIEDLALYEALEGSLEDIVDLATVKNILKLRHWHSMSEISIRY